jgi:16S rRNA G966 N2-methylase RsmD
VTEHITTILRPEVQQFIRDHLQDDPFVLSLQSRKYAGIPVALAADQIRSRQKLRDKVPLWAEHEQLVMPPPLSVEQCTSQAAAEYKAQHMHGRIFIDLTGGAGVDTYFLGRHFQEVYYVESNENLAAIARHNFHMLAMHHVQVVPQPAEHFLAQWQGDADLIYIDPSRRTTDQRKVFRLEDSTPDLRVVLPQALQKARKVMMKLSPMADITDVLRQLHGVQKVTVLAIRNECKELLLYAARLGQLESVEAVNIQADGIRQTFTFHPDEEAAAKVVFDMPQQYLYEPNAAVMKSGAFKLVAERYGLAKLHPHSHLYTSHVLQEDFPGHIYRILQVTRPEAKAVRKVIETNKAHLVTRNFPMKTAVLQKKLGIEEGGFYFLYATTLVDQSRAILVCTRLEQTK